jgi:hypothetical protein
VKTNECASLLWLPPPQQAVANLMKPSFFGVSCNCSQKAQAAKTHFPLVSMSNDEGLDGIDDLQDCTDEDFRELFAFGDLTPLPFAPAVWAPAVGPLHWLLDR